MLKQLSIAAALLLSPLAVDAAMAECGEWTLSNGRTLDLGELCDSPAPAPATQAAAPETGLLTVCNNTSGAIHLAISSGTDRDRHTEGLFLLLEGDCESREVHSAPRSLVYARAWSIHDGQVFTGRRRLFCVPTDYYQSNTASRRDDCVAASQQWQYFDHYRLNRDGTRTVSIEH